MKKDLVFRIHFRNVPVTVTRKGRNSEGTTSRKVDVLFPSANRPRENADGRRNFSLKSRSRMAKRDRCPPRLPPRMHRNRRNAE